MEKGKFVIALDTNILVRFLVDDDPAQADIANELMNHPSGVFISKTTLLELEWVLRHAYKIEPRVVWAGLKTLLGIPLVTVESVSQVSQAMQDFERGMDFADALHLASADGNMKLYTFDQKLAKLGTPARVVLAGRRALKR
jgi:predicted nucleic-acid-binding protein